MIRVVVTFKRDELLFDSVFAFDTLDLALSFIDEIAAIAVTEIENFTIFPTKERQSLGALLRKHQK